MWVFDKNFISFVAGFLYQNIYVPHLKSVSTLNYIY